MANRAALIERPKGVFQNKGKTKEMMTFWVNRLFSEMLENKTTKGKMIMSGGISRDCRCNC